MAAGIGQLYQTGENVISSGIYQLVEPTRQGQAGTQVSLFRGENFPTYKSWEVCWYYIGRTAELEVIIRSPAIQPSDVRVTGERSVKSWVASG